MVRRFWPVVVLVALLGAPAWAYEPTPVDPLMDSWTWARVAQEKLTIHRVIDFAFRFGNRGVLLYREMLMDPQGRVVLALTGARGSDYLDEDQPFGMELLDLAASPDPEAAPVRLEDVSAQPVGDGRRALLAEYARETAGLGGDFGNLARPVEELVALAIDASNGERVVKPPRRPWTAEQWRNFGVGALVTLALGFLVVRAGQRAQG